MPDGFGNDLYSPELRNASNFRRISEEKPVSFKLFLSHEHALLHNVEYKKVLNFHLR